MGDFVEQAQTHKFGSINSIDPVLYRGKIVEGTVPVPESTYEVFPNQKNNRQYESKRKSN